ncbi:MAG TPA: CYTH and CHAD domain-containing protein [Pseudonocardiaceae bacterium]
MAATFGLDHRSFDATYYDTKDLRLAKAGIGVRKVASGQGVEWWASVPVGDSRCHEVRFPPVEPERELVPAELGALLVAHTAGRELRPCAQVATERDRWRLTDTDGAVIADVVVDDVTGRTLGLRPVRVSSWQEVRVDAHGDRPDLVKQVSARLSEAGWPRSRRHDPLARILRTCQNAGTQALLGRKASAAEVLGRYLHDQIAALRAADVALRLNEPDGLHDLRVSVRRLRNCIRVFGKYFEPASIRSVRSDLVWLSGVLGDARDVEVVRQQISASLRALPAELVLGPVSVELERLLARREAAVADTVQAAISGPRYLALQKALERLLVSRPYRPAADQRATTVLPRQIRKSYRKVCAAVEDASGARGPKRDAALHSVRRKVKRLRHACEAAEPVIGKPAERTRRRTKEIQRTLGNHHDGAEVRRTLRELGSKAHLDGGNGFTFGLLHGQAGERGARQEAEFAEQWRSLTHTKTGRWLRE